MNIRIGWKITMWFSNYTHQIPCARIAAVQDFVEFDKFVGCWIGKERGKGLRSSFPLFWLI